MFKNDPPVKKSDQTRKRVFDAALTLISKKGFDATTMRDIAAEAGVAQGAAYYYFDSKESIVHEYYKQSQEEHVQAMTGYLATERRFSQRLHRTVASKIEQAMPYKNMARALYRVAADPDSPLSPFSKESQEICVQALAIFTEVVEGSREKFHPEIRAILPRFLWLYLMGIILFWIYDESKNSVKTFALIDRTVPFIVSANKLIQSPWAIPFRGKVIAALKEFAPEIK
jgi:AcrR family transcriptional regulator